MKNVLVKIAILTFIILIILTLHYKSYCISEIFKSAEDFLKKGESPEQTIDVSALNETSKKVFNVFLVVGTIIAVLVGAVLGIKIMVATVEEKAKIKELMVPYIVGCIVMFSAFTIWKTVVTIGNSALNEAPIHGGGGEETPIHGGGGGDSRGGGAGRRQ